MADMPRWKRLFRASTAAILIIIGVVFALIVGFLDWVARVDQARQSSGALSAAIHLLQTQPVWTLVVVMLLLGCFLATDIEIAISQYLPGIRPRFSLSYRPEGACLERALGGDGSRQYRVRVAVRAKGDAPVDNCEAYLIALSKNVGGKWLTEPQLHQKLKLEGNPFRVGREGHYVGFAAALGNTITFDNVAEWPHHMQSFFNESTAIFRFAINVLSRDQDETIHVDLHWTGQWDTLKAAQVSDL